MNKKKKKKERQGLAVKGIYEKRLGRRRGAVGQYFFVLITVATMRATMGRVATIFGRGGTS